MRIKLDDTNQPAGGEKTSFAELAVAGAIGFTG